MNELTNENGIVCARIDVMPEDGDAWAIVVSWKKGIDGLPDVQAWNEGIESNLAQCKKEGATTIDSRVITATEGVNEALVAARAKIHRDSLIARGFKQGEGRVEYRMAIDEALVALEARNISARLAWSCVDTGTEADLARAARFFRQAAEGDPAAHSSDDTLGFLRTLLETEETVKAPERIQIGTFEGIPAAVLALMVYPSDGWSTIYYLGVLPDFRGRGFGAEVVLHGLRCLKAMGGSIYHDGTGSGNAPARALFARLGRPPFRTIEEWRLGR
jgi:ribosomal protein S18 acetylase RimI-like enzyme